MSKQVTTTQPWSVPILNVVLLRNEFLKRSISVDKLLNGTELSEQIFNESDILITYDQAIRIFENALDNYPERGLGLRFGRSESPTDWGILGYAMLCCETVGEAIDVITRFHKAAASMTEITFQSTDIIGSIRLIPPRPLGRVLPIVIEEHFSSTLSALKKLTGKRVPVNRIYFSYSKPDYINLYKEVFGCPMHFDQLHNQMLFDSSYLDTPIIHSSNFSSKIAKALCEKQIERQEYEPDIIKQVRYLLLMQGNEFRNESEIAGRMHMTSRTLRNRLNAQGTSFQKILDDVRKQLAISYLESSSLTLSEIANMVGFDNSSNFRRAFKKWTGKLPSDYR